MPTVVSESDVFAATFQRPNNGELADAASLNQFVQVLGNSRRYLYNRVRTALFDITRAPFNADPTGATVSTTGIQAAISAAAAAGGHVFSPGGNFRHGLLTIPSGVSIFGVPDRTFWLLDSTSANGLVFTDFNSGNPATFQDIRFLGNVAATGTHVVNNADARVNFIRCSWNGFTSGGAPSSNLQGKTLSSNSAGSETSFYECRIEASGDVNALDVQQGEISIFDSKVSMPATYSTGRRLVRVGGRAMISGVTFDCSAHSAGSPEAIFADATGRVLGLGLRLIGGAVESLIGWAAGAKLVVRGIDMSGTTPFPYANPGVALADGSELDMLPFVAVDNSSATCSIPLRYHRVLVRDAFVGSTAFTMPAGIVSGQVLHLTIFNNTASGKSLSFASTPLTATAVPTIGAGATLTGTFVWSDAYVSGTFRWVQQGTWGVGANLV